MLPGIAPKTRSLIEAVHEVTALPLCVWASLRRMIEDRDFLERKRRSYPLLSANPCTAWPSRRSTTRWST